MFVCKYMNSPNPQSNDVIPSTLVCGQGQRGRSILFKILHRIKVGYHNTPKTGRYQTLGEFCKYGFESSGKHVIQLHTLEQTNKQTMNSPSESISTHCVTLPGFEGRKSKLVITIVRSRSPSCPRR